MEYNVLKQSIAAVIKANGNEEITGDLLQQVLIAMVDVLGAGYQFAGLAVPTTNPGTPDAKMFYIATQAGTYSNFGSPAPVLTGEQVAILRFSTSWTAVVLDIPTKAYVDNALSGKVDKVEGKGLSTNDLTNELVSIIDGAFQKANITDELGTDATKVLSQAAITTVLLQYAKVDGYYSSLTAGAAENLVGRGSVPASFLRRTTGGTADVGTGSAKIAKLMGNSIVWNQLCPNGNFASSSGWNTTNGSLTVSGNKATFTASAKDGLMSFVGSRISGHKYLVKVAIKTTSATDNIYISSQGGPSSGTKSVATTEKQILSSIYTAPSSGSWGLGIIDRRESDWDAIEIENFQQIDLTLMFGAGKEPSTVAEFEALFSLDYYVNNNGEVLPFAAQKLVTTGFNQWDEEWEEGDILASSGENSLSTTVWRSKNYIPVFPDTTYFACSPSSSNKAIRARFYDANHNYIGYNPKTGNTITGHTFTTPDNAYYMRFAPNVADIPNHDICINLSWSGYRDGEYVPYEKHELTVDPANWEDANGDKIFPYGGMHGVGTARDFATPDNDGYIRKATRVFARVDLGTLSWTKYTSGSGKISFYSTALDDVFKQAETDVPTILCAKYLPVKDFEVYSSDGIDKVITIHHTSGRVYIADSAYDSSTGEQFTTAMDGVYLVYELDTPVETELATPVAASYYANDFGTEEWQPANDDEPYTAPCEMQIAYAMNAVDTLRRLPENYISVGSFENFCTELATKLGAALNKNITITPTYDSENAEYNYSITIADIEG